MGQGSALTLAPMRVNCGQGRRGHGAELAVILHPQIHTDSMTAEMFEKHFYKECGMKRNFVKHLYQLGHIVGPPKSVEALTTTTIIIIAAWCWSMSSMNPSSITPRRLY